MDISEKGLLHFDQETLSLISNQTYHRTNMFSPYQPKSCYESDYECNCIIINGKTCSVPLNILSSVYGPITLRYSFWRKSNSIYYFKATRATDKYSVTNMYMGQLMGF